MSKIIEYYGRLNPTIDIEHFLDEISSMLKYWELTYEIDKHVNVSENNNFFCDSYPISMKGGDPPFYFTGITIQIYQQEERANENFDLYFREDSRELITPHFVADLNEEAGTIFFGASIKANRRTSRTIIRSLLIHFSQWIDFEYIEDGWDNISIDFEIVDFNKRDIEYKNKILAMYM